MKKIIQAGLLIMCFLLAGCGLNENKEELTIKVNNNNIKYLLTSEPFTTKDDFKEAYLQIDNKELVYVPRDSKVSIDLNGGDEKVSNKAYWTNLRLRCHL